MAKGYYNCIKKASVNTEAFVPLIGQISNQFLCDLRGIAAFKGIFG